MTNSLIEPIFIGIFHVSAKFKLRSTGLSSEISSLGFAERQSPVYVWGEGGCWGTREKHITFT
jgi:hypothetical protein